MVPGAGKSPEPAALLAAGDVTTWLPDAPFDAVYDQTCLCALPPSLWAAYEARLRRWLRPGGRLFVVFIMTFLNGSNIRAHRCAAGTAKKGGAVLSRMSVRRLGARAAALAPKR